MRRQTWHPDTCGCIVEQEYDPALPASQWTLSQIFRKCPAHQSVPDDQLYGVLYQNPDGENKRKNLMEKFLLEELVGTLSESYLDDNGKEQLRWRQGVRYEWSFDRDRTLRVRMRGGVVTGQRRGAVLTRADGVFGAGRVVVE